MTIQQAYDDGFEWGADEPFYGVPPLSGQLAGQSIPELSAYYGYDLFDGDLAESFEQGFYDGQASVPEPPIGLGGRR